MLPPGEGCTGAAARTEYSKGTTTESHFVDKKAGRH